MAYCFSQAQGPPYIIHEPFCMQGRTKDFLNGWAPRSKPTPHFFPSDFGHFILKMGEKVKKEKVLNFAPKGGGHLSPVPPPPGCATV